MSPETNSEDSMKRYFD